MCDVIVTIKSNMKNSSTLFRLGYDQAKILSM